MPSTRPGHRHRQGTDVIRAYRLGRKAGEKAAERRGTGMGASMWYAVYRAVLDDLAGIGDGDDDDE